MAKGDETGDGVVWSTGDVGCWDACKACEGSGCWTRSDGGDGAAPFAVAGSAGLHLCFPVVAVCRLGFAFAS